VLVPGLLVLLLVAGLVTGTTAANYVPPSKAGISYHPASAQALAPPVCAGMGLQTLAWSNAGRLPGTPGNDLLLGSEQNNRIEGGEGNDCLLGGGGRNDRLYGGDGTDVCIGNADTRFDSCEVIIGGSGANIAAPPAPQEAPAFEGSGAAPSEDSGTAEDPLNAEPEATDSATDAAPAVPSETPDGSGANEGR